MIDSAELIAFVALSITATISIAAAAYALGSLPKRSEFNTLHKEVSNLHQEVGRLHGEVDSLRQEVSNLRVEVGNLRQEVNDLRIEVVNLRQEINDLRVEVNRKIDESHEKLIAEIRRSHRQLMYAIIHHRHPEPGGPPVFAEPADIEMVGADD